MTNISEKYERTQQGNLLVAPPAYVTCDALFLCDFAPQIIRGVFPLSRQLLVEGGVPPERTISVTELLFLGDFVLLIFLFDEHH